MGKATCSVYFANHMIPAVVYLRYLKARYFLCCLAGNTETQGHLACAAYAVPDVAHEIYVPVVYTTFILIFTVGHSVIGEIGEQVCELAAVAMAHPKQYWRAANLLCKLLHSACNPALRTATAEVKKQ